MHSKPANKQTVNRSATAQLACPVLLSCALSFAVALSRWWWPWWRAWGRARWTGWRAWRWAWWRTWWWVWWWAWWWALLGYPRVTSRDPDGLIERRRVKSSGCTTSDDTTATTFSPPYPLLGNPACEMVEITIKGSISKTKKFKPPKFPSSTTTEKQCNFQWRTVRLTNETSFYDLLF